MMLNNSSSSSSSDKCLKQAITSGSSRFIQSTSIQNYFVGQVRGLGGHLNDDETFGSMKIEGDRDKIIDTIYNIVMPDVNRKLRLTP